MRGPALERENIALHEALQQNERDFHEISREFKQLSAQKDRALEDTQRTASAMLVLKDQKIEQVEDELARQKQEMGEKLARKDEDSAKELEWERERSRYQKENLRMRLSQKEKGRA